MSPPDPTGSPDEALTTLVRTEGAMVLATLVRLTGDLGVAEDAVQDAAIRALETWPRDGVPPNPRAWLILTAKRRAIDLIRRGAARSGKEKEAAELAIQNAPDDPLPTVVRDDRLRLIFTCCHPALSEDAQIALSLRVLCGLSVAETGRALLVSEQTIAKRLTRARRKIADAGIPYRVPDDAELPQRLRAVATTVLLLFTEGYASLSPGPHERRNVADEAVRLGRALVELMPAEAVLEGLLATMLLQHSRRDARFDAEGRVVLLAEQDRTRWDRGMAVEGVQRAVTAVRLSAMAPERLAVTAAIAACHAIAPTSADTDWAAVVAWYDVLITLDPSPVVALNRAAAIGELRGPADALAEVDRIKGLDSYFWFRATRAELLARLDRRSEARTEAFRAAALTGSESQRELLWRRHGLD